MYSKASLGYGKVFGPEHAKSKTLRDKLCALDAMVEDSLLVGDEEPVYNLQGGLSHLATTTAPSISKRHKLFRKFGPRYSP
jgi:hypothetical protein